MLFLIDKQKKSSLRNLNLVERVLLFTPDEFRSLHSLPSFRFGSLANPLSSFGPFPCRSWLDAFVLESGGIYFFDKGYTDFRIFYRIAESCAFFFTRAKENLRFSRKESRPLDKTTGPRSEHVGKVVLAQSARGLSAALAAHHLLRREAAEGFGLSEPPHGHSCPDGSFALQEAWDTELFFKWIKGTLRLKHYFGTSPNAVKTQIWIAMATHLLVAILHKELNLHGSHVPRTNRPSKNPRKQPKLILS